MCCWGTSKKAYWHHNIFHLQSFITDVCGFGMIWLKLQRSTVVIDVHERNLLARCLSSRSREIPQSHYRSLIFPYSFVTKSPCFFGWIHHQDPSISMEFHPNSPSKSSSLDGPKPPNYRSSQVSGLLLQPLHHGILRRILPDVSMDGLLKGISSKMYIYIFIYMY